jgi:glycosyltransferase involved in cell wall biosynthesis
MTKKIKILRVSNASEHTSAPLNSFTLARNRFYQDEHTTFLAFFKNKLDAVDVYFEQYRNVGFSDSSRLSFMEANGNKLKFWKFIKKWLLDLNINNESGIIHIHQPRSGMLASIASRFYLKRIPIIYTVHNNFLNFSTIHKLAIIINFILVNKVVFVSYDAYNSFKIFFPFFRSKFMVIQNGVDVERIDLTLEKSKNKNIKNKESKIFKFISTGRFTEQKNQFFLIRAFGKIKDNNNWTLEIFGDGKYKQQLLNLIDELDLSNQIFLKPTVTRDEILEIYSQRDAYVSSALWEGLPVAVMEAMTCSLPSIVSNIPSHQELGNHEGVLITGLSEEEWQINLTYFLKLNKSQLVELGEENKKIIKDKHNMRLMMDKYRKLYIKHLDYK